MSKPIFFDGIDGLIGVLVSAPILYASIILFIRLSGKRSTSQMNNFDWIVTVALGSLVGSGVLFNDVTILETLLAIATLLGLQWLVTKLAYHYKPVSRLVKAEPALLLHKGEFLHQTLRRERVTEDEVLAAVREAGHTTVDAIDWVILETDASFSVIAGAGSDNPATALGNVAGYPPKPSRP